MKKHFVIFILFLFVLSCAIKETSLKSGIKFFYNKSEGYCFAVQAANTPYLRKIIPEGFKLHPKLIAMVKIVNYKDVYFPGADKYIECSISVLIEHKKTAGWYPLGIFTDIPPYNLKPYNTFKLTPKLVSIKYSPAGSNFAATVKKNYNLFLEFEFSFLPRENYIKNDIKNYAFNLPYITKKDKKSFIKTVNVWKGRERMLVIKDGTGAFLFHKQSGFDFTFLNTLKVLDVFYFEKTGSYTKKAYLVEM